MPPKNNEYPEPIPCNHASEKKTRGLCENCYQRWLYSVSENFVRIRKLFGIVTGKKTKNDTRKHNNATATVYHRSICKRPNQRDACFHIDHDHITGVVRGLLCFNCNAALGLFSDNPEWLRIAALYLEAFKVALSFPPQ